MNDNHRSQVLLSVHLPKTGGVSVGTALSRVFGARLLLDYDTDPANPRSPRNLNPECHLAGTTEVPDGMACVHGHYHPGKYRLRPDTILFTLLRHPVDNVISIYRFWRVLGRDSSNPLHTYFLEHDLSPIEMARLPALRWLYSRTYFGGFDMRRFDVIGRHEERGRVLEALSTRLGIPIDAGIRENVTPSDARNSDLRDEPGLRRTLADILADDIAFYERHAPAASGQFSRDLFPFRATTGR